MSRESPEETRRGLFASPLWRHGDFLKLWTAQTVSALGSRISRAGLPMAAIMALHAGPAETGALAAIAAAPALLVGLIGGGFVDRTSRRRVLIAADLGRAAALLIVPIAAFAHRLVMAEVFIAAAAVGGLGNLFDIADHAYLPSLVAREALIDANAKLATTESVGEIGGPAAAGVLFAVLTAPFALLANTATYLVSAAVLATIRRPEPRAPAEAPQPALAQATEGLRIALAEPRVRPLLIMAAISTMAGGFFAALYDIYALRTLGLSTTLLGLTIAMGGVGALGGAAAATWIGRRVGVGPGLIAAALASALAALAIPLAHGTHAQEAGWLAVAQVFGDGTAVAAMIFATTIRQSVLPQAVMGRVAGALVAVTGVALIAGALAGGEIGRHLGVRPALYIACAGLIIAPLACLASPLRSLRRIESG